jgi:predicted nucleic acid-binding protein
VNALPLVLDAAGVSALCEHRPPDVFRALLAEAHQRGREVIVATIVCAELARGSARTRALEAAVRRHDPAAGDRSALWLVDTDFAMARQVGAILHASDRGSDRIVDAHVVACCVPAGGGLVVTSDPADILELADAVPSARVRVVRL